MDNKETLKTYYETGDKPTQEQFEKLIYACVGTLEKTDDLPVATSAQENVIYQIGRAFYQCKVLLGIYGWQYIGSLGADGKVRYDADDVDGDYLSNRIKAGNDIEINEGTGTDENKAIISLKEITLESPTATDTPVTTQNRITVLLQNLLNLWKGLYDGKLGYLPVTFEYSGETLTSTKTVAEILAAITANKQIIANYLGIPIFITENITVGGDMVIFTFSASTLMVTITGDGSGETDSWTLVEENIEKTSNKVSAWSETPTNTTYPGEKLVKDTFANKADLVDGLVPSSQLPRYVDNIDELLTFSDTTPTTGLSDNCKYYAPTAKLIYTYNLSTETWDAGATPIRDVLYLVLDKKGVSGEYFQWMWAGSDMSPIPNSIDLGSTIHNSTTKDSLIDADEFGFVDSENGNVLKKTTWSNIKAKLTTLFDTAYIKLTNLVTSISSSSTNAQIPSAKLLYDQLQLKVTGNSAITGATKTKITYDAKGLVTGGDDATTADIADSTNKRYCTDAEKTVISNTSNTNTGDQDASDFDIKDLTDSTNLRSTWSGKQDALTFGIANTNSVKIDAASVSDNDYAKFTANGLEGRTYAEVLSDIGAQASLGFTPENVANKETSALDTSTSKYPCNNVVNTALGTKVTANAGITAATKTKITYDAKGLVTGGDDATTADIADSTNKRYVTDAEKIVIGNTSNINTGDQDASDFDIKDLTDSTSLRSTWSGKQDALTFGIANTNALKVDDASAADNDYAKFTANGLEGRTYAEVLSDIGAQASLGFTPENVANKVSEWSETPTDTNYPSEKLTKDTLANKADLVDGLVPSSQLPSFVDDVIELRTYSDTAPTTDLADNDKYYAPTAKLIYTYDLDTTSWDAGATPERGKIYVVLDDSVVNKQYRWGGSDMAVIANSDIAGLIHASTTKDAIVDADEFGFVDSENGNVLKKTVWSNIKAKLQAFLQSAALTITEVWTFSSSKLAIKGSSTGVTTFRSENSSALNYDITFQAKSGIVDFVSASSHIISDTDLDGTGMINCSNKTSIYYNITYTRVQKNITLQQTTQGVVQHLLIKNSLATPINITFPNYSTYTNYITTSGTLTIAAGGYQLVRYLLQDSILIIDWVADESVGGTGTDEKVKYDASDPTAGYIADKFVAGTGISLAEGTGANENKLVITSTSGDMLASTYDPTSVEGDAFDMDNMAEGDTNLILTADERTKIGNALTYFTLTYYQAKPATCTTGETCFDTSDGKIYTATATDTWDSGVAASTSVIYKWKGKSYQYVSGKELVRLDNLSSNVVVLSDTAGTAISAISSYSVNTKLFCQLNNTATTRAITISAPTNDACCELTFENNTAKAITITFPNASGIVNYPYSTSGIIISAGLRRTISWEMTGEKNSTDMNIFWGDEQSPVS